MVGLSLSLYVKRSLEKVVTGDTFVFTCQIIIKVTSSCHCYVIDVRVSTCGVGIGGVMGNKGAVAVRFSIFDSSVCILNSHLAAHQKNVKGNMIHVICIISSLHHFIILLSIGRNSDFHNICKRLVLPLPAAKDKYVANYPSHTISSYHIISYHIIPMQLPTDMYVLH
jgi:hypothetical protein